MEACNEELLLLVALLADAGDEASRIIRFFDGSSVDSATASGVLRDFQDSIVDLFCNEKIFTVRGHALCMLQWLETPHIFRSSGGKA